MANTFRGILYFVVLVLVQVLILNNIHFLRLVIPFLYIYFILKMPVGFSSGRVTFLSFLIGLTIDIFSNTPGMHAAACTLAGFARQGIFRLFIKEDMPESTQLSYRSIGFNNFFKYTLLMALLHHTTLFILESLTLYDPLFLLIRIIGSVVLTTLLVCIVESFHVDTSRNGD